MATIKAYTDLAQSKKLTKILPIESADMFYNEEPEDETYPKDIVDTEYPIVLREGHKHLLEEYGIPCWSLAALYSILPNNKKESTTLSRGGWKIEPFEYLNKWFCEYEDEVDEDSPCKNFSVSADNPIDACYEMILKLNELNLL